MTHLQRAILTLAIIFASVGAGYLTKRLATKERVSFAPNRLDILRGRLQTVSIFGLMPFSAMLSLWGLPHPSPELLYLPLMGLASYIWGGMLAFAVARLLRLTARETGSFYCCGTFTNLGAVGALVCLLFLGENSIALVALYRLLEEIFYFGISFPVASKFGRTNDCPQGQRFLKPVPFLLAVVCALALGILLNLAGVPRAPFFGDVASLAMLFATVFFLFAIGLALRLSSLPQYWSAGLAMCLIKFVGIPLFITALAFYLGLGAVENGLPLKLVCVLSSMPVAMTALAPPSIFSLDVDLANACWIYTTLGLAAVLPALMLILPLL